ncbi:hypothetical protein [Methylibium sp.]|uniref:hypothetical protein n=1 Tax=Methylibium sp. TaxID=2067992 RepID=UPI00286D254E|nr:hypothetical protein [Methylibium sp.]
MNQLRNSLVQPAAAAAPERWSVTVAAQDTVSLEIPADAQRERSFDEAAKLAEQGDRSALTRLTWMYEAGRGVPRNLDERPGASRQRPKRVTPRPSTPWR